MSESILEIEGLESGYGEVQVLWGVDLAVPSRQLTTVVGANGAGKTTTLRTVTGMLRARGGRVRFENEDVTRLSAHAKAARGLVLVPEGRQLFADMSVQENLEMGAYAARARAKRKPSMDKVFEYFPRLKERRRQRAGTFSGGEQQMLAVGRGLMADPKLLLIDELSLGLAPVLAQQLFRTLKALKDGGLSILLVEQNVHLALAVSDYAYVMAEGKVHSQGSSRELARDENIRQAYMGI